MNPELLSEAALSCPNWMQFEISGLGLGIGIGLLLSFLVVLIAKKQAPILKDET